jgi:tetratricopeptide (TPR) repeat protein
MRPSRVHAPWLSAAIVRRLAPWAVATALTLAPVAIALSIPRPASRPASLGTIAVPSRGTSNVEAADRIDSLPLIVDDLPDGQSQAAARVLRSARGGDADALLGAFRDTWAAAIRIVPEDPSLVDLGDQLVAPGGDGGAGPPPADGEEVGVPVGELDGPSVATAIARLARDPRAPDRISNAATALVFLSVASGSSTPIAHPNRLRSNAELLLHAGRDVLPGSRALLLNSAFLAIAIGGTTTPPPDEGEPDGGLDEGDPSAEPDPGAGDPGAEPPAPPEPPFPLALATDLATRLVDRDAGDVTARALLSFCHAVGADPNALDVALADLAPLSGDPRTVALAHDLRGDALLITAHHRAAQSPYLSAHLARQALSEYDRAVEGGDGAAAMTGRARALQFLGSPLDAGAAMDGAAAMAPASVELVLEAARLRTLGGDAAALDRDVTAALDAAVGWAPPVSALRLTFEPDDGHVAEDPGIFGFLGWSVGGDRTPRGLYGWEGDPPPSDTVGFSIGPVLIPTSRADATSDPPLHTSPPAEAVDLAYRRAILLGQPLRVPTALDRPVGEEWLEAIALATGQGQPAPGGAGIGIVEDVFRAAGRFADAERTCRRALDALSGPVGDRVPLLMCVGETAYHAGRPADALAAFESAIAIVPPEAGDPMPWIEGGVAARATGDHVEARRLLTLAVTMDPDGTVLPTVLGQLGEIALAAGEPSAAIASFDVLLAITGTRSDDPDLALLVEAARNNVGVARLRSQQTDRGVAPSCDGSREAICVQARDDIAAAHDADPDNPFYLLNAAVASRALGDEERARAELVEAAALDPSLFMAWNDAGVLAATAGDRAAALAALDQAVAARPDYDLGHWNLGLVEVARGELASGAGDLAEAARRDPDLVTGPLALRFDERAYEFAFGAPMRGPALPAGGTFDLATVGLATVAAATTATSFQMSAAGSVGKVAIDQAYARLSGDRRLLGRLRASARSIRRRLRLPQWVAAGPTLAALTIVTLVSSTRGEAVLGIVGVAIALLTVAAAVAAHELGHLALSGKGPAKTRFVTWWPGVALGLVLAPLGLVGGPYPSSRGPSSGGLRALLAGFGGNGVLFCSAYAAYLVQPVPFFRLLAQAQLLAMAYAMLPFGPQEGRVLKDLRPGLAVALDVGLGLLASAFAFGVL